jgi:hypothetical protein
MPLPRRPSATEGPRNISRRDYRVFSLILTLPSAGVNDERISVLIHGERRLMNLALGRRLDDYWPIPPSGSNVPNCYQICIRMLITVNMVRRDFLWPLCGDAQRKLRIRCPLQAKTAAPVAIRMPRRRAEDRLDFLLGFGTICRASVPPFVSPSYFVT